MNMYPNILTPPSSSSEDSPQNFHMIPSPTNILVTSPNSMTTIIPQFVNITNQQYDVHPNFTVVDQKFPFLEILEQPTDKFRFRYKSEMAGTHGSLTGLNSDKTRKHTYPTVRLRNFHGTAIVRCSLYQHGSSEDRQPHAHKLIKKENNDESDDPHSISVSPQLGYDACFHSMGIIHTAKKNIVSELIRKKTLLKKEDIARREKRVRKLTTKEEVEIKASAEDESKSINLNIVSLRFDAFDMSNTGILTPLCNPVYSHGINNLKSALTGELKIVRMDHSSSPAKGGREIFMLVEKVTKKNIRIRFFETNDEDVEIWQDRATFSDLDVHHQYAIVFKTPPYRDTTITQQKEVFIELYRPSDGSRSEPREFTYYPSENYKPGMKRARCSDYSFSSSFTNSLNSDELPTTVTNLSSLKLTDKDLEMAVKNVDSNEFVKLFGEVWEDFNTFQKNEIVVPNMPIEIHPISEPMPYPINLNYVEQSSFTLDSPEGVLKNKERLLQNTRRRTLQKDTASFQKDKDRAQRVFEELTALIGTKPDKQRVIEMLNHLFTTYVNEDNENALHFAIMNNDTKIATILLKCIHYLKQNHLLAKTNSRNESYMHLAVKCENINMIELLLKYNPDLRQQDELGNTVLHTAIIEDCSRLILKSLLACRSNLDIDAANNDNNTALSMAVKTNSLETVELLCKYRADVNKIDKNTGRTVLHVAVAEQAVSIVDYLLKNPKIDVTKQDYNNYSPLKMAYCLIRSDEPARVHIYKMIEDYLVTKGLETECIIKEEKEESEEEMELDDDMECKEEQLTQEELTKLYKNITNFTPDCLNKVSEILDASGNWECLASLLDLEHILLTDLITKAKSPSKALLMCAIRLGDVLNIRNFLENLEEMTAVSIIDNMAKSENFNT